MSKMRYQTARALFLGEVAGTKLNLLHVLRAGQLLNKSINDIKLFGMSPINWYAIGIRIMGRTAVGGDPRPTCGVYCPFNCSHIERKRT